jgi:pimeloyl-ACP methyl ester carboxylesterase
VHPPYSVDQYADDLAALLDSLRIERAVVCGLSMGGYVALAFWRRHRARVRALILMDTRAGNDSAEGRERRDQMIALARQRGSEAVADAMITGMVGKRTREKCRRSTTCMVLESAVEVVGRSRRCVTVPIRPRRWNDRRPALIVVGDV